MSILQQITNYMPYIFLGIIGGMVLLLFLFFILLFSFLRMKKNYNALMKGERGVSLEKIIKTRFSELDDLKKESVQTEIKIKQIKDALKYAYRKKGIVKYNAFDDMGGELSFVLTLLNEKNDGFIINSMHGREGCYTYVKEVKEGNINIAVSEEEKESLENAMANDK